MNKIEIKEKEYLITYTNADIRKLENFNDSTIQDLCMKIDDSKLNNIYYALYLGIDDQFDGSLNNMIDDIENDEKFNLMIMRVQVISVLSEWLKPMVDDMRAFVKDQAVKKKQKLEA